MAIPFAGSCRLKLQKKKAAGGVCLRLKK